MYKITAGSVFDIYRAHLDMFTGILKPILYSKFNYFSID